MAPYDGVIMKNRVKTRAGFTLLETVAAVSLAGVVIAILVQVFVQSIYTQKQLAGRVTAVILGAGKLNELVRQAETAAFGVFPVPYQHYRWECRTERQAGGLEKLELVVEWSEKDGLLRKKTLQYYRPAE
jgi:prepilin-type N-terminal cleavage/methylation domain-containing protein